ncbi:MAG: uracil-DNA glycosylase [Methylococcales bacterium]|nr:uracil-DNA glycosylase [Methylococcales bacterium]
MAADAILACQQCPRLAAFLNDIRGRYPDYHARPVPAFGAGQPRLLIVGLAPGLHGANATGRPFTGDYAGILLYQTLYDFGFSNTPVSERADDGLELMDCRITNAVKCLPPQNKPNGAEIATCNTYLTQELACLAELKVILALGRVAHGAVLKALRLKQADWPFAHHRIHTLPSGLALVDSYHSSRYNIQTKRLTSEAFTDVFVSIRRLLS